MDTLTSRVHSDFNQIRFQAFLSRVRSALTGQPAELLSFDEIKRKFQVGGPIYQGVKTIRLEQIVGSLNRHHEFDRAFRPFKSVSPERWRSVDRAFYEGINLPAVVLYKVGELYFVVDGHHRVSVARARGQMFIEAEVREFSITPTPPSKCKDLGFLCAALA